MVSLSQRYLDLSPAQPENQTNESLKTLLRLLIALGGEQLKLLAAAAAAAEAARLQQPPSNPAPLLQELLLSVGQGAGGGSGSGSTGGSLSQSQQLQQLQQQQSQMQQPLPDGFQNILSQIALSNTPFSPQMLLQMSQQQEQQNSSYIPGSGNPNQNSNTSPPQGDNCRHQ